MGRREPALRAVLEGLREDGGVVAQGIDVDAEYGAPGDEVAVYDQGLLIRRDLLSP